MRGGSRRKEKCHHCGECDPIHIIIGGCSARKRLGDRAVGTPECADLSAAMNARKERTTDPRRHARSRAHELFTGAAKTEFLADINELNASIDSGRRVRGVAQLLLAHADRIEHGRVNIEWVDQGIPDRFCAPLTQTHIELAAADGVGVTDNKKAITEQNRIVQCIGDGADRPV